MPPPTSFLYFTRARSGSMPVVSQSIMKPMVPVGASTALVGGGLRPRSRGSQRLALLGHARRLPVGIAAHDGGKRRCKVAAGVGVIRQAEGHQQSAQVGIAETQRTVVVRVLRDRL